MVFENGADAFFHKGTNGRWRDVLTPAQLDGYDAMVAGGLPDDAAQWLEYGSLATGTRPSESSQIQAGLRTPAITQDQPRPVPLPRRPTTSG